MKRLRGGTRSPISMVKVSSACLGIFERDLAHGAVERVHGRFPKLLGVHLAQAFVALNMRPITHLFRQCLQVGVALALVVDVLHLLAVLDAEQRRLGDVQMAAGDDRPHVAEEEGQQQRADVAAVHVGVGHDHDPMVAQLRQVELIAHACADRGDQRPNLVVREHFVEPALLDIQDLTAQRQDGLEAPIAALLGRTTGRVALDDVDLTARRVGVRAVGQFAGQREALHRALACRLAHLLHRQARARGRDALFDNPLAHRRGFLPARC